MTIEYETIAPPSRRETLAELRLPFDALRWTPDWFTLPRARAAVPRHVMLLPGFGGGPRSLAALKRYLRRRGHDADDWGLGRNTGRVPQLRAAMHGRVEARVRAAGEPIVLVGWSLGGYLAREFARENPTLVRKIVTLGSPVVGGPRFTATARWYSDNGFDLDQIEHAVKQRYARPLTTPVVAIYSKRDGVVAWRACIDRWSPNVRHVEVDESHIGMGFAPRVLRIVAEEVECD
ncbi:MAG TPA: alpha/beta fold hydrolase [Steroidobacteraceae bacterium]|nr:alpha/beta fold hydrolase [Steroidobacteraceae bacterium]